MKKEKYLLEFQIIVDSVVKNHLDAYDESDLDPDKYIKSIHIKIQTELGRRGSIITERSLREGIDDLKGLDNGIKEISRLCIEKLQEEIYNKFKNKKHE